MRKTGRPRTAIFPETTLQLAAMTEPLQLVAECCEVARKPLAMGSAKIGGEILPNPVPFVKGSATMEERASVGSKTLIHTKSYSDA